MENIYLIYGSDYSLIKRRVDLIKKDNQELVRYDLTECNVSELIDDASSISMFDDEKLLIGENALFLTSNVDPVSHNLDYLEKYLTSENHKNVVIFYVITDKLDVRKKIVKTLKDKAKVFHEEAIDKKNIGSFIVKEFKNKGYNIDLKTANYFNEFVGSDIDIILSEIDKMVIYKEDNKNISKSDIDDISSRAFKDNIFEFTDAIMKKDYKKIFLYYNDLLKLNEDVIKFISVISNQFILIYQVKILSLKNKSQKEIASILGIHPYRVKLAYESDYFINELEDMIKKLHELDLGIKIGKLNKEDSFLDFLIKL